MEKKQFDALTALKGIFIMLIVFHNSFLFQPLFDSIPGTDFIRIYGGDLGNSMFFLLSGFLMANAYRERITKGGESFGAYLSRRLWKLYPLYLLTNAVSLLLEIIQYGISAVNLKQIVFTLLLQTGGGLTDMAPYNHPAWFLGALFVCYILFYFICFYAKQPTQYWCALALCIIWGYTLVEGHFEAPFCYPSTGTGLMNFFIGCALAEIYPAVRQKIRPWHAWAGLGILLVCLYWMLSTGVEIICGDHKIAFAFFLCPLVLFLAVADWPGARLLRIKPFVWLGKISTNIFFWHLVIYHCFRVVFQILRQNPQISEGPFIVYLIVLLAWCTLSQRIGQRRQAAVR